jgi:hypothetical protein
MASPIRQDGGATSDNFGRPVDLSDTLGFHDVDFDTQRPRPYSSEVHVEYDAMSHTGHVRENNEDAFLVYRVSRSWERLLTNLPEGDLPDRFDENAYVFCVADGMGGVGRVGMYLSALGRTSSSPLPPGFPAVPQYLDHDRLHVIPLSEPDVRR